MIPPQTSTIASHLPKAVGAAHALGLARRNPPEHQILPRDGIAMCSFGDASANHSTAQGAINAASWTAVQGVPLPLLFVCEDNGIGISTKTPTGWIKASMSARPGLRYFEADGLDLYAAYASAKEAADYVRKHRKPAFLHLRTVRLYGHAGADVATSYLPRAEVETDEANDPLLHTVGLLNAAGVMDPTDALAVYTQTLDRVAEVASDVVTRPRLTTAADVMASIVPPKRPCVPTNGPSVEHRADVFGSDLGQMDIPQPLSKLINWALHDLMLAHPETQSILGFAIGAAHNGFIPMPEIQFLAYLHNAEDQLRGEAATLPFFSNGQWSNPMVLRIAGLGYQKGFGGHFHNDNSLAVLRDIPGIVIACPSTGADAALMLREAHRLAREEQRVVHGDGSDLAILTYGNGHYLSRQAQADLAVQGIQTRVIDMRWIAPLAEDAIIAAIGARPVLIVDECRRSGGQAEALMALLQERGIKGYARLTAEDSFIATGPAYAATLPSRESIVTAAHSLLGR